jgi:hypothetical protein
MILVRDIFHLKFGKAKDAKAVLNEGKSLFDKFDLAKPRAMTDLTGPSYTLVMETEWKSLGEMENSMQTAFGDKDWQNWYQKFVPLVDSGSREIYTLID